MAGRRARQLCERAGGPLRWDRWLDQVRGAGGGVVMSWRSFSTAALL